MAKISVQKFMEEYYASYGDIIRLPIDILTQEEMNKIMFEDNPLIEYVNYIDNPYYGEMEVEIKIVDYLPVNMN